MTSNSHQGATLRVPWTVFTIYKNQCPTQQQQKTPFKNGQVTWIDISLKMIYKWPNKYMERFPITLITREMQIKITTR